MIVLFRIDERLVHGQVVTAWVSYTRPEAILVFDELAAQDELLASILQLAAPPGIRLSVHKVSEASHVLQRVSVAQRVMIIVKDVHAARLLYEACGKLLPAEVNIGNAGMQPGRTRLTDSVYLDAAGKAAVQLLLNMGCKPYFQLIPARERLEAERILV